MKNPNYYKIEKKEKKENKIRKLKPFTMQEIQICPICGKVDAYKNDGHNCAAYLDKVNNE